MNSDRWAGTKHNRDQHMLIPPSIDDMIPAEHKVRDLEEVLFNLDWSGWESEYNLNRGQPPIHPRLIAGAILYGLTERVRSSRDLEKACSFRTDFMWLLSGRKIDHSTFANFRTRFTDQLHKLFKEVTLVALQGKVKIDLAIDGTRIRANSSRSGSLTEERIKKRASVIEEDLKKALEEMEHQDILESPDFATKEQLQSSIKKLEKKKASLAQALDASKERNEVKRKERGGSAISVRTPITDTGSYLLNNKEGGFAPNYTPTVAVETENRVIISLDIPEGNQEATVVKKAVTDAKEVTGEKPASVLFDSSFATGTNLKEMSNQKVDTYSSAGKTSGENPAIRDNLNTPVPEEDREKLPTKGKKNLLSKEVFIYDPEENCYWCPMGQKLKLLQKKERTKHGQKHYEQVYRSTHCEGCALAEKCLNTTSKKRITRDEYEHYRDQLKARMKKEEGQLKYKDRGPSVEGVFGHIKQNMGVRQFAHRGMKKVKDEWTWICTAYNISKVLNSIR